jgi:hypothetical protein
MKIIEIKKKIEETMETMNIIVNMKILEKTSNKLVIQQKKSIGNIFALALLTPFLLIGLMPLLVTFMLLPSHQTLRCTRVKPAHVNCQIEKYVIGIKSNEIALTQITGAEVIEQEESNDDGTYKVYQIKLYTKYQSNNFGITKTDKVTTKEITKQINNFVANSQQQTFQVTKVDQSLTETGVPIIGFLFFTTFWSGSMGLIIWSILSSAWVENWDFDKKHHQLKVTKWFLIKTKTKQYSLLGQLSLKIDDFEKDSDNDTLYKLNLILNCGEKIIWNFGLNNSEAEKLGNEIGQLLNLKVEKSVEMTANRYLNQV